MRIARQARLPGKRHSRHARQGSRASAGQPRVVAVVESAPVRAAASARAALVRRHFSRSEARHFGSRPAASLCAAVALKKALARSVRLCCPQARVVTKDFCIAHDRHGAPTVRRFLRAAASLARARPRISLSHTSTTAYALVAFEV